jgi:serine/threonine-protein kinase
MLSRSTQENAHALEEGMSHPHRLVAEALRRGWLTPDSIERLSFPEVQRLLALLPRDQLRALETLLPHDPARDGTNVGDSGTTRFIRSRPPAHAAPKGDVVVGPRYDLGEELGRGGAGTVRIAEDRVTGRTVALKTVNAENLRDPDRVEQLLAEARMTARLEHPGIIPVYDLSVDGPIAFYTMRRVGRRSLRDVLAAEAVPRSEWPLGRLCSVLVQICRALSFAHSQKILHRDLKPSNILLGDFGEVYVADWGIATSLPERANAPAAVASSSDRTLNEDSVSGTPGYVSPEQLVAPERVDHRADLFALGVILYEILTGALPFLGASVLAVFRATLDDAPKRPREVWPGCPLALDDLCIRLLSKKPNERPVSAADVAREVEQFLEGARERLLREAECAKLMQTAGLELSWSEAKKAQQEKATRESEEHLGRCRLWDSIEVKREGWEKEDTARRLGEESEHHAMTALRLYTQALAHLPDSLEARAGVADYYRRKSLDAERRGDERERSFTEAMMLEYDDGRYAPLVNAPARLSVSTDPPGAQVVLYRYAERTRRLWPVDERVLGTTPLQALTLEPGSYLLVLRSPGCAEVRYPVVCKRGQHHEALVRLFPAAAVGDDFVHVPAGTFLMGGDPEALNAMPRREVWVDDFALGRRAVTFGEYLAFLQEVAQADPEGAKRMLPRNSAANILLVKEGPGGWEVDEVAVTGQERGRTQPWLLSLPAGGMDFAGARAFIAWKSQRDGSLYSLPGEAQFEKACRGADGRIYPWGNGSDPSFCNMRDTFEGGPYPMPVASFPVDESVYGVLDLAGASRCWLGDIHTLEGPVSDEAELNARFAQERALRGGSHTSGFLFSRGASRSFIPSKFCYPSVGFRLCKALRPSTP